MRAHNTVGCSSEKGTVDRGDVTKCDRASAVYTSGHAVRPFCRRHLVNMGKMKNETSLAVVVVVIIIAQR